MSAFTAQLLIGGQLVIVPITITLPTPYITAAFQQLQPLTLIPNLDSLAQPLAEGIDSTYLIAEMGEDEKTPTGIYKIGKSMDMGRRLSNLQTGNPNILRTIGICPGGLAYEGHLHRLYDAYRFRSEWFRLGETELAEVKLKMWRQRYLREVLPKLAKPKEVVAASSSSPIPSPVIKEILPSSSSTPNSDIKEIVKTWFLANYTIRKVPKKMDDLTNFREIETQLGIYLKSQGLGEVEVDLLRPIIVGLSKFSLVKQYWEGLNFKGGGMPLRTNWVPKGTIPNPPPPEQEIDGWVEII